MAPRAGQTLAASALAGIPTICTSATRPPSPIEGALIFETDTDRIYFWSGSAWVYLRGGQDPTAAHAYRTTALLLTPGSGLVVPYNVEQYDYGNNLAAGVYTCPTDGIYAVNARHDVGIPAAGERFIISILRNGAEVRRGSDVTAHNSNPVGLVVSAEIEATVGQTLSVSVFQVAGVARNISVASALAWATWRRVSQ